MRFKPLVNRWGIVSNSDKIKHIIRMIEDVAPTDISVLIYGESGTGKEMIAKAIHKNSKRKNMELITVNCGAIPEGILESELFGHEKGSFTGAVGRRKGYFEIADKGTIFLDEIGEMSLQTQVKFLRVLENGEFMRVGGTDKIKVDTRVIAATNKNLEKAVENNEFRKDLYYRLKAFTIFVPPLRERPEDISILVEMFAKNFAEANGIEFNGISKEALEKLLKYPWPGNIRELKNLIESLVIIKKGEMIQEFDLPENIRNYYVPGENLPVTVSKTPEQAEREIIYRTLLALRTEISEIKNILMDRYVFQKGGVPFKPVELEYHHIEDVESTTEERKYPDLKMRNIEKELIIDALNRFNGNRRKSAKALGISERTLYRKLKEYKLTKNEM
ncbi:sigma-54-dependent Fis family transcriptional regulator [candidate division KSB1 bacterium]|nr:MAG: sigma-54-dependent Fis family transcriptional regulator [candidate division KSB1 bacterium]